MEVALCTRLLLWSFFFNAFWWLICFLKLLLLFWKALNYFSASFFSPFNVVLSSESLASVLENLYYFFEWYFEIVNSLFSSSFVFLLLVFYFFSIVPASHYYNFCSRDYESIYAWFFQLDYVFPWLIIIIFNSTRAEQSSCELIFHF